LKEGSRLY